MSDEMEVAMFIARLEEEIVSFQSHKLIWNRNDDENEESRWRNILMHDKSLEILGNSFAYVQSIFATSWLNESGFSTMKLIKNSFRSSLTHDNLRHAMRVALQSSVKSDHKQLVKNSLRIKLSTQKD